MAVSLRVVTYVVLLLSLWACSDEAVESSQQPSTARTSVADAVPATYVGSERCASCHEAEFARWQSSHHHAAMQPAAAGSNLGDFSAGPINVEGVVSSFSHDAGSLSITTDDELGNRRAFDVEYTFGIEPLQQYLLAYPDGRLQASALAWDSREASVGGQRWFHLQPDSSGKPLDVLHWTKTPFNWNTMCADCHSTAVKKGYDPVSKRYDTTFSEVTVGCEACHGPASAHVANPTDTALSSLPALDGQAQQINSCAYCHSRRSQLAEGFRPDKPFLDHYSPALLDAGLYHPDGQILDEVYVYGSFLQSKMHASGVTCSNCHDSHSAKLILEGDALCTQCHNEAGRADFPSLPLGKFDVAEHHFHDPAGDGARCVNCHMPSRTYMSIDDRRDHSFRVPRPDLSSLTQAPNACNACHAEQSSEWAAQAIATHFARSSGNEPQDLHFSQVISAARRGDAEVESQLAALAQSDVLSPIVRATLLSLTAQYSRGETSDAIRKGLRDAEPLVRIGALRGAMRWPIADRWQKASHLLNDELLAVRSEAARTLSSGYLELSPARQKLLAPHLTEYRTTLSLNADRAEAQSGIAALELARGNVQLGEEALEAALAINAQWVPALVNLADLYRNTQRDQQGGALLDRALLAAPEAPDVALAKGLWLVRQQRSDEALLAFEKAWTLAPQGIRFGYTYAIALNSLGNSARALEVIDAQLVGAPHNRSLLEAGASIARDAGLADKAQTYLRKLAARGS